MSAQPQHPGLTYDEIREWATILTTFTASDLASAMGVDVEIGRKAVRALCAQGICRDTGDVIDGRYGYEPIVRYLPPPPGPTTREPSAPDPVQQAISQAGRISVQRGTPVRIRTERAQRRSLSTPGARQKHKNSQREWDKMQAAKTSRAAAQKAAAKKDPKWKKKK